VSPEKPPAKKRKKQDSSNPAPSVLAPVFKIPKIEGNQVKREKNKKKLVGLISTVVRLRIDTIKI
jgi:hypothetical protein